MNDVRDTCGDSVTLSQVELLTGRVIDLLLAVLGSVRRHAMRQFLSSQAFKSVCLHYLVLCFN